MAYNVEEVNSYTKKLIFSYQDLDMSSDVEKSLKEKQKIVEVKGFRKGKVPLAMVSKMYQSEVEYNVLNSFIDSELNKALEDQKLNIINRPVLENLENKDLKKIDFNIVLEIFPTPEIKDYSHYEFKKEVANVNDEEVDAAVFKLFEKHILEEEVAEDLGINKGNIVRFDFEGEMADGEKPENMKSEGYSLEIGSGNFIPGFEDNMLGLKKGEEKTFSVTFPADYHEEKLKNAEVKFSVKVLEIKNKVYPEITDELAKEAKYDSVSDMREAEKTKLYSAKEESIKQSLVNNIIDQLVKDNEFEIPQVLINESLEQNKRKLVEQYKRYGFTDKMIDEQINSNKEEFVKTAERDTKVMIILKKIIADKNIVVEDEEYKLEMEKMASQFGITVEQLESYYKNKEMSNSVTGKILETKLFDTLIQEVKLV